MNDAKNNYETINCFDFLTDEKQVEHFYYEYQTQIIIHFDHELKTNIYTTQ